MTVMTRPAEEFVTIGDAAIELKRRGNGPPLLLLPGEEALEADAPLVERLATDHEVLILSPPGFERSHRPGWIVGVDDISYLYLEVLDKLKLTELRVIGCSLGGWIAAEMATKDDGRFSKLVLAAPYGIKVGGPMDRDIADIWTLPPQEVTARKWFNPEKGKRDFNAMSGDELAIVARNIESFARFCWQPYMHNPQLRHRLRRIGVPTLLVWGAYDGIVTSDYGRAYCEMIPGATMTVIDKAGHLPQIEQPDAFMAALAGFL
jgi:pimeloyl-ACP methyl ester carboxylesterase